MSDDSLKTAREDDEYAPSPIPAMPAVPTSEMSRRRPRLLAEYQLRHSLGWLDEKTGPSFVVVTLGRFDRVTVTARFPLTAQGWEDAWRALSELDADATAAVGAQLAKMEARRSARATVADLDARTVRRLRYMTYNGGSGDAPLVRDRAYDLRFLGDRLMVCPPESAVAVVELPYHEVDAVQVSGSDRSRSTGETLAVVLSVGLLGALLGLIVLGFAGLIFGGLTFGLIAAVAMANANGIKTVVRIRSQDAELFFQNTQKSPDAVRVELSGPLTAIEAARAAGPGEGGAERPADRVPESIPDQLSKLASLLADGVLTQDEFERLKAKVIAQA